MSEVAIIVLAAGMGTRMKSNMPKVLHKVAGRSLLGHVLTSARALNPARVVVVVGPDMDAVAQEALRIIPACAIAVQVERRGTGHAVSAASQALAGFTGTVVVLYADAPLVQPETVAGLVAAAKPMAVLGFEAANPHGYGRLVVGPSGVTAIVEELDANSVEKSISLCNSGILSISSEMLWTFLPQIGNANAKHEYYLTDLVELVAGSGKAVGLAICPEAEVAGINDRAQLAAVEAQFQQRARLRHMLAGVTLHAPETIHFSADTVLGRDVTVEPHVMFGPGVSVGDNVEILGFSHIEGAIIATGARIGPFARLRPGAEIGEDAHIGNFVEVKKARIGKGAKANHLAYIGDAVVGAKSNIGAGAITCNYDGFEKHLTEIGENVFVGSNTAMVAPVKIGAGASIAAGSVITTDVPGDALAMTRPDLQIIKGWAARYRKMKQAKKDRR